MTNIIIIPLNLKALHNYFTYHFHIANKDSQSFVIFSLKKNLYGFIMDFSIPPTFNVMQQNEEEYLFSFFISNKQLVFSAL